MEQMREAEFESVFQIMEQSFPEDERRPMEEQKAFLKDPRYTVYVLHEGDTVSAFITAWKFETFVYVEHFAVRASLRGKGLGGKLLTELLQTVTLPICLEVELPDTDFAKRRIAFYQRNGFSLNEYPYLQPPISQGKKEIPLLLMTSGGKIDAATFSTIRTVLYREVYRVTSKNE